MYIKSIHLVMYGRLALSFFDLKRTVADFHAHLHQQRQAAANRRLT